MLAAIPAILKQKNILSHANQGITICSVKNQQAGIDLAATLLYAVVDQKTVLYLSGGKTPKELYEKLNSEERLRPGAVGMVDERFGPKFHPKSNELMIKETGLLRYLQVLDIPFYPMLSGEISAREKTASRYDEKLRSLNATFQKSVAILGVGEDGHTAGIPAQGSELRIKNLELSKNYNLVTEYDDASGKYGERVTMTFLGLSMLDILLVLAFGPSKADALDLMFSDGSEQEIPARFYKRPDVAPKTIIITDQQI